MSNKFTAGNIPTYFQFIHNETKKHYYGKIDISPEGNWIILVLWIKNGIPCGTSYSMQDALKYLNEGEWIYQN